MILKKFKPLTFLLPVLLLVIYTYRDLFLNGIQTVMPFLGGLFLIFLSIGTIAGSAAMVSDWVEAPFDGGSKDMYQKVKQK